MGEHTNISWCDMTFNPWWGCVKCGPGCEHCYAERFASRMKHDVWGPNKPRRLLSGNYWRQPLAWNRRAQEEGVRQRVFCGSMCDVFEIHSDPQWAEVLDDARARLWALIRRTPWLDWLLLTKRPQNVAALIPSDWPFPNIWLGVSVSNQRTADERIWALRDTPATVKFVSLEPILEEINLRASFAHSIRCPRFYRYGECNCGAPGIDWVIVGAESGPQRRPFDVAWAADIKRQCDAAGVSYFGKQDSGLRPGVPLLIDGRTWYDWPEVKR